MHVKCIHELCIILLIFQSYLHHIRVISLVYIDFGKISLFPYFSGINPAQVENPIFYNLMFQGPKRRRNDLIIYEHQFLEGQSVGAKEANKRRPEAQKGVAHAATVPGRVGPTIRSLGAPMSSIFLPEASSWPKTDYKNSPRGSSERSAAETQKPRNRDLEL